MVYFEPGSHALFLLTLCVLAPIGSAAIIAALTAASRLRHRGQESADVAGLALTGGSDADHSVAAGAPARGIGTTERSQIEG